MRAHKYTHGVYENQEERSKKKAPTTRAQNIFSRTTYTTYLQLVKKTTEQLRQLPFQINNTRGISPVMF